MNEKPLPKLTKDDYYFNQEGLMVFTEQYHLKRGYCCKSGCKHCPWQYKKGTTSPTKG
ncbi:DUF5522 domain-containing protein [Hugenholtzia roseola]|uniref:DUF5522 domain-containing protein n=1 Tax=Hugenholtzia roseola TaxID=1002 RepID=UPI000413E154|nr:DUF5522 domain-containing protein [Hugenholtzia roseola]